MRYALLCYDSDAVVGAWTPQQEEDVYTRHAVAEKELADQGRLGPNLSLMPTSAAITVRSGGEPIVMDGPFAETKEQLLGFWIIDCASLEDAIETARRFASHKQTGAIEIRPVAPRDQGTACRRFEETQRIPLVDLPLEDFIFPSTTRRETL